MHLTLAALQVGKMTGLVVDIQDLLVALSVKGTETLTSWCAQSLLEVRVESIPSGSSALGDAVLLIDGLYASRSVVLLIKIVQGLGKAGADAVLLIKVKGSLDSLVADDISVREVFGKNARTRLVLLRETLAILIGRSGRVSTSSLVQRGSRCDLDLRWSQLSVIKQERSLGSRLFLE